MVSSSSHDAYSLFVYAIKSPMTREKYEGRLRKFFDFIGIMQQGQLDERCNMFAKKAKNDTIWVTNCILNFMQMQKQRADRKEISGATVRNYLKTIKLFCEMSEILIAWKRITRGLPKGRRYTNDRAPTRIRTYF
jgi:hypothetical protein